MSSKETLTEHTWWPTLITYEYEWPPSIKSPNDTEFLDIRRSTVEEDPQRIPIYGTKGGTRLSYKRVWLSSSKVSSLILLGETLSNLTLRFPFPNRHWLKYRSKSHPVPHGGLCFASLHSEADQPLQDTFDPHLSLHRYNDINKHQQISFLLLVLYIY